MTKVDLRRVLDLDAQATEGPWESTTEIGLVHEDTLWSPVGSTQADVPEATADAELIAYYRTAAPAMAKALHAVLDIAERAESKDAYGPNLVEAVRVIHYHLGDQDGDV